MRILFLGGIISKEMEKEIIDKKKGKIDFAANKFQWNLIDGFMSIDEIKLEVISAPFVGAYPKYFKDLFIEEYNYSYIYNNKKISIKSVPFCNLWGYRNISRKKALKKAVNEYLLQTDPKKVIVVYSAHTPLVQAAAYAKQEDPSVHICLVVPDLPQYMNLGDRTSFIYSMLKKVDIKILYKSLEYVDSFVLLTEYMKDILKVKKRPYIVIEGMVNKKDISISRKSTKKSDVKTVVYTGSLNKKYGVVNLVKAFLEIDMPNVVLKIAGSGDSEKLIREYAQKDNRIQFLGQLSNKEAIELQRNATVLVNPRQNIGEFTKYSFPSKNLEYLLSGNPVIAYKLDGIPSDYDSYFFYVKDNSVDSLKNKIVEVLSLTEEERKVFGERAKEFVIKKKNNVEACFEIYKMLKDNLK
ncbi:MAG: hypothetical protein PWQ83_1451 [Thermosipho sp. (in: thermotogales)]|jgi:glycosyltransferase involved in cell wall biosynthesis|nr:hypothetical protein [Thermosipho sp. (in: thermotogales)]